MKDIYGREWQMVQLPNSKRFKLPKLWIVKIRIYNWFWYVGYKAKRYVINKMG